ncbi:hypothetical protein [Cupriavidus metallidurans]|uniref:hypothetical protein n=1 Tax=Cupriavidus metallidurans TaxID=119219 RepID=UPI000CE07898|nr:hypothetical protein [Cupriavidus metallidurans]AVA33002.1 hypothetical protein C3Z06_04785 [Cupriavidus metallidurans]
MSNEATRFSADRQPTRRRGKELRTRILEAIKEETKLNEKGFYKQVAKMAITNGETLMMKELLTRVAPAAKPVAPAVQFDFPENGTPVAQVDAVLRAVAAGKVSPDVGQQLVSMIRGKLDVLEISELADRLAAVEKALAAQGK